MFWNKKIDPSLPWYRQHDYKGKMTEANKRKLDTLRDKERYPSTRWHSIPEDVRNYISRLELELYDYKQQEAASRLISFCLLVIALMALNYFGFEASTDSWLYVIGIGLIAFSWFSYSRKWKATADEFLPKTARPISKSEEEIRQEWELEYLTKLYRAERGMHDDLT